MSRPHHSRQCRDIQLALVVFCGGSRTDLPDDIALHVEGCPDCMANYEQLFPPLQLDDPAPIPQLRHRLRSRGALAVAGIALVALGMNLQQPEAEPFTMLLHGESALTFEEMLAVDQECPIIPGESDPPVCAEDDGEWM